MILAEADHEWLAWKEGRDRVQVLMSKVIPIYEYNRQTDMRSRKRLRASLEEALAPHGWVRADVGTHLYFEKQ